MNRFYITIIILAVAGCATRPVSHPTKTTPLAKKAQEIKVGQAAPPDPTPAIPKTPPVVRVGRFRELTAAPLPEEQDLLEVIIDITFPGQVTKVNEAIGWLLLRSGWRLEASADGPLPVMAAPLPEVHRHLGPMTLRQALKVLTGDQYRLCEDPRRRVLWYRLNKESKS